MGQLIRTAHKLVFSVVPLLLVIADVDGYLPFPID
jgi:hypothetical protein